MKKNFKINISNLLEYNIKEAFEYYETNDFTKLKYYSNTNDINAIDLTLQTRNINANILKGWIYHKYNTLVNIIGYISNIKMIENFITFDLNFLNTNYGKEYYNIDNVGFNIILSRTYKQLDTSGACHGGAILRTYDNSIFIKYIIANNTNINKFIIIP